MRLLIALVVGLVIVLCGIYALTTHPSDQPAAHPEIDSGSRSLLLEELRRDETGL